jgi:3-phenylpropionate/trans-cinnamate dioxygenase ferredoxin subunit
MSDLIRVCRVSDVPDPGMRTFEVEDRFIILFHMDGEFHALDDRCTHDGGPLGEGILEGFKIICPRHGAQFDIRTGLALTMPATRSTAYHPVTVEGDEVFVQLAE